MSNDIELPDLPPLKTVAWMTPIGTVWVTKGPTDDKPLVLRSDAEAAILADRAKRAQGVQTDIEIINRGCRHTTDLMNETVRPPVDASQEREAFEAWFEADSMPAESDWFRRETDDPDEYAYAPVHWAWKSWQARATLSSTPATVPDGYELVVVPKSQPGDEPDWDECLRQCEETTGIKVERHTFSILIREVRRWLAHRASPATVPQGAHPPSRQCMCRECWPSFSDAPFPEPAATVPQDAAAWLQKKADDYAQEFGGVDPDTGTLEFRNEARREHHDFLSELADEWRAMLAATPNPPTAPQAEPGVYLKLTPAEVQSGYDRVRWAAGLIRQLPENHDGRNSWLLNHGEASKADWVHATVQADPTPDRPIVDITPPATARDRWMFEQGRLAERDPRTQPDATADAERWRHVRDVPYSDEVRRVMSLQLNKIMDATIDAARASGKGGGE